MEMSNDQRINELRISRAFTPAAPIDRLSLFAGRQHILRSITSAITQRGQHVILFGERGVGKTSLGLILNDVLQGMEAVNILCMRYTCSTEDDYSAIIEKILKQIVVTKKERRIGFIPKNGEEQYTLYDVCAFHKGKRENISPDDVRLTLYNCGYSCVLIIDEIDRIKDDDTRALMADTVKTLSDNSVDSTMVLIGVADSVDQLIAGHGSIARAVVQVRMHRMTNEELYEILDKHLHEVSMRISGSAKKMIASLSRGLPQYTHLLGQQAALNAFHNGRNMISEEDVKPAIDAAIDAANQSIRSEYSTAVASPQRNHLFDKVLLACALAQVDEQGFFFAGAVKEPLSIICNKDYGLPHYARHLGEFIEEKRGRVLQKIGSKRHYRYRFRNPILQPYVVLKGLETGYIDDIKLSRLNPDANPLAMGEAPPTTLFPDIPDN